MAVTWDPTQKGPGITLFLGDLSAEVLVPIPGSSYSGILATEGKAFGKWYWEYTVSPVIFGDPIEVSVGVSQKGTPDAWGLSSLYPPNPGDAVPEANTLYRSSDGTTIRGGVSYGPIFNLGTNNIGVLLNLDDLELSFIANGFQLATISLQLGETYYPFAAFKSARVIANFGASGFSNVIPSGFTALNGFDVFGTDSVGAFCKQETSITQQATNIVKSNISKIGEIPIDAINTISSVKQGNNASEFSCRRAINNDSIIVQEEEILEDRSSGRLSG